MIVLLKCYTSVVPSCFNWQNQVSVKLFLY